MGVPRVLGRSAAAVVSLLVVVTLGQPPPASGAPSPEGRRAAVTSGSLAFLEGLVTPDRRPVLPPWPAGAMWPTFSPDGARIAWTQTRLSEDERTFIGRVVVMSASGEERDVLPNTDRVVSNVTWSPDGGRLAVVTTDGVTDTVWLLDAAGTAEPTVALTQRRTFYSRIPHLAWSPGGRHLALVRGQFLSHDVFLLDVRTGELRQVTRDCDWQPFGTPARSDCGGEPYSRQWFEWAPDGRSLYGIRSRGSGEDRIVRVRAATGRSTLVARAPQVVTLAPSPDGRSVAYSRSGSGWVDFIRTFVLDLRSGRTARVGANESGWVTSWQACPSGACTAFGSPRHPTTMEVAADLRTDRVRVTVSVAPVLPNTDETVAVTLSARRGGRWVEVAERRRTTFAGSFQQGFARPGRTDRCRVEATFAGNAHRRAARATVGFDC
jgi:dipeptidyl aminopeptidase/acylaminoacyl peptidase